MSKIRNIVFCVLSIVILAAAIEYKIADFGDFLPDELYNGQRSYLEGKDLQTLPAVSPEAFADGTLQDQVEDYLSGCWPARDEALLANATLQRGVIQAANLPFGFEAWPTFFGSTKSYSPEANALFEAPILPSEQVASTLESTAQAANELHSTFPEAQIVFAMSDRSMISEANPVLELSGGDVVDYDYVNDHLFSLLDEDIAVVTDPKVNYEDYLASYFNTDHHWRMNGAYEMYCRIAETLGIDPLEPIGKVSYPDLPFFGSNSRSGLDCSLSDIITDYEFDLPEYQTWRNGKLMERNHRDDYLSGESALDENLATFNTYAYYYGSDFDRIVYTVEGNKGKSDCVIIGDSYTQPIEPLIASSFQSTFVLDPRHYKGSLADCIRENDVDTIIVLAGINTITSGSVTTGLTS